jgi:ABC-type cobalamin transport system permease subunit
VIDQLSRLLADVAELLRLRGSLARSEVNRAARRALIGAALVLAALVLVMFTGPLGVVIAILLLSTVMPAWAAAGVMVVVSLLMAAVLVLIARRLLTIRLTFPADLREDWRTIKTRVEAEA